MRLANSRRTHRAARPAAEPCMPVEPCPPAAPAPPLPLRTAHDILALLAEQVNAVRADPEATAVEKARTVGALAGVALRAVETAELADRLEALERALKMRAAGDRE